MRLDLSDAEIVDGKLNGANMEGINLSDAFFKNTKMVGCNLRGADLRRTQFDYCTLSESDLTGADLTGAQLESPFQGGSTKLGAIVYDESTIWPEGFTPPPSANATQS